MRRIHVLLGAAVLALAPAVAADPQPSPPSTTVETFEASTMTSRVRLGVLVTELTPELRAHFGAARDRGVLVGRVEPGSAAARAGIVVGDVITNVKGAAIEAAPDVIAALAAVKQGDPVTVSVIRDRKPQTLNVKVEASTATSLRDMPFPRWFDELFAPLRSLRSDGARPSPGSDATST